MFRKKIQVILSFLSLLVLLTGCGSNKGDTNSETQIETKESLESKEENQSQNETAQETQEDTENETVEQVETEEIKKLKSYIDAVINNDDEKATAMIKPLYKDVYPEKYLELSLGEHEKTLFNALRNPNLKDVEIIQEGDAYIINLIDNAGESIAFQGYNDSLFDDNGDIIMDHSVVNVFAVPKIAHFTLNGKEVKADRELPDGPSDILTRYEFEKVPYGEYSLEFKDSYIHLDDIALQFKRDVNKGIEYFGKDGLENDILFKEDLRQNIVNKFNEITQSLFDEHNKGDIKGINLPKDLSDELKESIVQSIKKMNGMNKVMVKGKRVFYPIKLENDNEFEPIDDTTFILKYKFDYDGGDAKGLSTYIDSEIKYLGNGEFEILNYNYG